MRSTVLQKEIIHGDFTNDVKVKSFLKACLTLQGLKKCFCKKLSHYLSLSAACKKDIHESHDYQNRTLSLVFALLVCKHNQLLPALPDDFDDFRQRFDVVLAGAYE